MNVREVIFDIIGRDRLSPTLDKIGVRGESARKVMSSLNRQTLTFNDNIKTAAAEIPGLSRGLTMLRNPAIIAGTAIAGTTVALKRATDQAARFNHEFRNLANLNLGKTRSELRQLKELVMSTSYAGGFDLSKTNSAFFDVQSVTGLSGAAAAPMVRKGMEFARLLGADPNAWVQGLALAQANFGFSNRAIDDFQSKAYATLKAGNITFDQIAQLIPRFAGTAASSGQGYEEALKMFTLFTMRSSSRDQAATMTQALFRDLTNAGVIKGFTAAGVKMFDKNGNIRPVSTLLEELSDRFAKAYAKSGDAGVVKLRNQFAGSEGINALLNTAADRTATFKDQLRNFADSELELARVREIAKDDAVLLSEELRNRLNVSVTQLGESLLPLRLGLTRLALAVVDTSNVLLSPDKGGYRTGYNNTYQMLSDYYGDFADMDESAKQNLRAHIAQLRSHHEGRRDSFMGRNGDKWWTNMIPGSFLFRPTWAAKGAMAEGSLSALDAIEREVLGGTDTAMSLLGGGKTGGTATDAAAMQAALAAAGGGRQQKVVNVTIGSLVGSQSFNTSVRESRDDITSVVEEALLRAINGAEQIAIG